MVVANSTDPRNGRFVEVLGTYNPVAKPVHVSISEDRALHWLMQGAQPSETAAIVLNKLGVLDRYFEARPKAKQGYKFLDKRTAAMSVKSVIETPAAAPKEAPTPAPAEASSAPEIEPIAASEPVVQAADSSDDTAPEAPAEPEAPTAPADEPPVETQATSEEKSE
jgi:small subunit ribosomal protein S16